MVQSRERAKVLSAGSFIGTQIGIVVVAASPECDRDGAGGCCGDAAAVGAAGAGRSGTRQVGVDTGEMAVEGGQFRDPPVGVGDPGLDQPQQLVAHGGADVAVTGVEEFADLVQAEAAMNVSLSTAVSS
jgi:hypothetical protein